MALSHPLELEALVIRALAVERADPEIQRGAHGRRFLHSGTDSATKTYLLGTRGNPALRRMLLQRRFSVTPTLENGYFRAKMAHENLIKASGIPYTILHSTQFFEFIRSIIESGADGDVIRLSPAFVQPIASDDVAATLADLALGSPLNATVEVAGPEACPLDKFARKLLAVTGDRRQVIADVHARYFGTVLNGRSLTPGDHPGLARCASRTGSAAHRRGDESAGRPKSKAFSLLTQAKEPRR